MPLSSHYNGQNFRAIDALASTIGEPLSSALEGQLANGHEWLHRQGAGAVARVGAAGSALLAGYNNFFYLASEWASVLYQPFLVTRGLKEIKVSFVGTIEAYNVDVRLEMLGFGKVDAVWALNATANEQVLRTITLTLDEPAEYEYETDLILWAKSQLNTGTTTTLHAGDVTEGLLTTGTATLTTNPNRAIALVGPTWETTGFPVRQVMEPLVRNPSGRDAGNSAAGVAVLSERYSGALTCAETEIARMTARSLFVKQVFA